MKFLNRLSNFVYSIEKIIAIVLVAAMLISLSAGVLYRYVLSSPLVWSDEVAIFSLIWLSFIGGSMSIKRQDSAAVTIFMDKLTGTLHKVLFAIGVLVLLSFVVYIFYLSWNWLTSPNIAVQRSSSMGMPMIYAYLSIPVSFLFMIIHTIELLFIGPKRGQGGTAA